MSFGSDNYGIYLNELLNYPLMNRCTELGVLIDRCSTKELQDFFPTLINSIFGVPDGTGWGFRTLAEQSNPNEYNILFHFFVPLGPMFRLCYRLLNEPIKFEVPIEMLPRRTVQMLHNGNYPLFYGDMLNIDLSRRQIISLSLNAFDYFMLHFVLHGMVPLHKMYPSALAVHNEKSKTVYFLMTAEYLCWFLPSNPDSIVLPTNICSSVKVTTQMPIQPIQPTRTPKYLQLSTISHSFNTSSSSAAAAASMRSSPETVRTYSWRTETVLYFFIDTWLRYDVDDCRDLPSSEFIRVVRILIKQLHAFGNSADLDNTSMAAIRKLAQPLLNEQIYQFLRCIISRWPLDSSFSVVLELWLSYIQPWRYTLEKSLSGNNDTHYQLPIPRRFESFILENMVSYTQILLQLLPRFQRLDFSSLRNVIMLFRLIKVFGQSNLAEILRNNEYVAFSNKNGPPTQHSHAAAANTSYHSQSQFSPQKYQSDFVTSTPTTTPTIAAGHTSNRLINRSADMNEWGSYRSDQFLQGQNYMFMFGETVKDDLRCLIQKIIVTREIEQVNAENIVKQMAERYKGFRKWFKWLFADEEDAAYQQTLADSRRIPEILNKIMESMSNIFEIALPNAEDIANESAQYSWDLNQSFDISAYCQQQNSPADSAERLCPSPLLMKKRAKNLKYMGDPALIPIQSNEITVLVRCLHVISCNLNIMYSSKLLELWHHNDVWGRLARQILYPPMTIQTFDKTKGISMLCEERMGPRITLRFLASYQNVGLLILAHVLCNFFFSFPILGLFIFVVVRLCYLIVLSMINDN